MELEPWMRGNYGELDAVRRGVIHALELAEEDAAKWTGGLGEEAMWAAPAEGVAPVGFHLRHIARSLDRMLTYAEGRQLDEGQLRELKSEMEPGADAMDEFRRGIASAKARVRAVAPETYEEARELGRRRLPTTVGGLLIHCAEHTARHVGQAVTTAKLVRG